MPLLNIIKQGEGRADVHAARKSLFFAFIDAGLTYKEKEQERNF